MDRFAIYNDFEKFDISALEFKISESQVQCLSTITEQYVINERKREFFLHIITFLIDEKSNASIGFCYLNIDRKYKTGEIFQVWVDEPHRNKKKAIALMKKSICHAEETTSTTSFSMPLSKIFNDKSEFQTVINAVQSALIDSSEGTSVYLDSGGMRVEVQKNKFPDTVFHYTSSSVLLNIVKNGSIWLGGRWHLNDSHEGEVFNKIIKERAAHSSLDDVDNIIKKFDMLDVYINCMTPNGDMLSQWRGYAGNGAGVSIGFDTEILKDCIAGSHEALLYPVEYADNFSELSLTKSNFVNSVFNEYKSLPADFLQSATKERWAVKGKGFKEEAEIRLIVTPKLKGNTIRFNSGAIAELKYRATDADIRDYYEFTLPPDKVKKSIRSVILGPKNTSEISTIERFLVCNGYENVDVSRSRTTYR